MEDRLVVNLSFDYDFFDEIHSTHFNDADQIIDFTGIVTGENKKVIYAREISSNTKLDLQSIDDYVTTFGKLSQTEYSTGKLFRDIEIEGLLYFWITELAVKHPTNHWGSTLFFFKNFVKQYPEEFIGKELHFVINFCPNIFNSFVKKEIGSIVNYNLLSNYKTTFTQVFHPKFILKEFYNSVVGIFISKNNSFYEAENYQISFSKKILSNGSSEFYINKFLCSQRKLLYLNVASDHIIFNPGQKPLRFKFSVGPIKLIVAEFKRVKKFFQIKRLLKTSNENDWFRIHVFSEILKELSFSHSLLHYLKLKSFLSKVSHDSKLFFEDELYKSGRLISNSKSSIKSSVDLELIGCQHGNISLNHTVYAVSDYELEDCNGKKNSIPFPDFFLVWGKHYYELFTKRNSLNGERIKVTGSLKHLYALKEKKEFSQMNESTLKILWCATSFDSSRFELKIIEDFLKYKECNIQVRMHPAHNIEGKLREIINPNFISKFSFQIIESFNDQIANNNLCLCSYPSTIYLDSINLGIPCVRLYNPSFIREVKEGFFEFPWVASSGDELNKIVEYLLELGNEEISRQAIKYLYNSFDCWEKVVGIK